jgi:hypothetical protein
MRMLQSGSCCKAPRDDKSALQARCLGKLRRRASVTFPSWQYGYPNPPAAAVDVSLQALQPAQVLQMEAATGRLVKTRRNFSSSIQRLVSNLVGREAGK